MSLVGKLNQSFSSDRLIPYALQCSNTIFLADHQLKIFLRTSIHSCIFIIVTKGNFCQVRIVSGRHPTNPTPPDFTCFSASARIFRISWGWSLPPPRRSRTHTHPFLHNYGPGCGRKFCRSNVGPETRVPVVVAGAPPGGSFRSNLHHPRLIRLKYVRYPLQSLVRLNNPLIYF
jgi:hypothetical protein